MTNTCGSPSSPSSASSSSLTRCYWASDLSGDLVRTDGVAGWVGGGDVSCGAGPSCFSSSSNTPRNHCCSCLTESRSDANFSDGGVVGGCGIVSVDESLLYTALPPPCASTTIATFLASSSASARVAASAYTRQAFSVPEARAKDLALVYFFTRASILS